MDAPREVFIFENVRGQIFVHSTKGPMVFLELEHAEKLMIGDKDGKAAERKAYLFSEKWSITRVPMNPELSSQPFRYYEEKKCDTMPMMENAIYLADLRDKVAMVASTKRGDDIEVVGTIKPKLSAEAEYLELRAKLKALGVNVRSIRKLPRLRAMLAEAEAVPV